MRVDLAVDFELTVAVGSKSYDLIAFDLFCDIAIADKVVAASAHVKVVSARGGIKLETDIDALHSVIAYNIPVTYGFVCDVAGRSALVRAFHLDVVNRLDEIDFLNEIERIVFLDGV